MPKIGSALDRLIEKVRREAPDVYFIKEWVLPATRELAELRKADKRTLEHCLDCGVPLILDTDAPDDAVPYCPACELERAHDALQAIVELGKDSHVAFDGERWREMWKVACAALEAWREKAKTP